MSEANLLTILDYVLSKAFLEKCPRTVTTYGGIPLFISLSKKKHTPYSQVTLALVHMPY